VARRFNHLYGRASDCAQKVAATLAKLPKDDARYLEKQRRDYQEAGKAEALAKGESMVHKAAGALPGWSAEDTELLLGHLKGTGKTILPEPAALHTEVTKLPGLDGAKMSKSYGNAIAMREPPAEVERKIRRMPTDPARVHRTDRGNPDRCPVWQFHKVYSDQSVKDWVWQGCTTAGIGCLDCKQPVIEAIQKEQQPWRERAEQYLSNPKQVHWIVEVGTERARTVARETMRDVREAMGLVY
jgi:tryptophanyl-tRNA synthetase